MGPLKCINRFEQAICICLMLFKLRPFVPGEHVWHPALHFASGWINMPTLLLACNPSLSRPDGVGVVWGYARTVIALLNITEQHMSDFEISLECLGLFSGFACVYISAVLHLCVPFEMWMINVSAMPSAASLTWKCQVYNIVERERKIWERERDTKDTHKRNEMCG